MDVPADLIRTASDRQAIEDGCYYDDAKAEHAKEFIERFCKHSKGSEAGKPFLLADWQWHGIIRPLFGWRRSDGTRRYRRATIFVPRRNGKTFLVSAIAQYMTFADGEPGAETYILASGIEQAGQCYDYVANSIDLTPSLRKRCWVRRNLKRIEYGRSFIKVLSGSKSQKTGQNIHCLIFDEIHEQKDDTVISAVRHGMGSRRQPLLVIISTCGENTSGPGRSEFDYALKVQSGDIIDTALLPCVYAADDDDAWDSLETARKTNPSYGVVISPDSFAEAINEARNDPRKQASYETYRINRWIGTAHRWISTSKWQACGLHDWPDLSDHECVIGLDFARRYDLCAYALIWRVDQIYYALPRFFIPADVVDARTNSDHFRYRAYVGDQYSLMLTPGDCIDCGLLREQIRLDCSRYRVRCVAYDPTGFEESRQLLQDEGITCIEIPQSWTTIGPAAAEFERSILANEFRHPHNPILTWNLDNCVPRESPWKDMVRPGKASDGSKIDGISAVIHGIAIYLQADEEINRYPVFLR